VGKESAPGPARAPSRAPDPLPGIRPETSVLSVAVVPSGAEKPWPRVRNFCKPRIPSSGRPFQFAPAADPPRRRRDAPGPCDRRTASPRPPTPPVRILDLEVAEPRAAARPWTTKGYLRATRYHIGNVPFPNSSRTPCRQPTIGTNPKPPNRRPRSPTGRRSGGIWYRRPALDPATPDRIARPIAASPKAPPPFLGPSRISRKTVRRRPGASEDLSHPGRPEISGTEVSTARRLFRRPASTSTGKEREIRIFAPECRRADAAPLA